MRTTIVLDDDVAAAVDRLRREASLGLSEAVNRLVRAGLIADKEGRDRFVPTTHRMGLKVDVTNIGEALETLEGPSYR